MAEHEALELFAAPVANRHTEARETFLAGLLAQWAASDRARDAKPTKEEQRRGREGARAALGETMR